VATTDGIEYIGPTIVRLLGLTPPDGSWSQLAHKAAHAQPAATGVTLSTK